MSTNDLIESNNLEKVWYPCKEEWNKYINFFKNKNINVEIDILNSIKEKYTILDEEFSQGAKRQTYCNFCNSALVKKVGKFGVFYACPEYPKNCKGEIVSVWRVEVGQEPQYHMYLHMIGDYVYAKLNKKLNSNQIKDYLDYLKLPSLLTKYKRINGEEVGFLKATERAKNQEGRIKYEIEYIFGKENVLYQQPIFYKLKNWNATRHKVPDFIVLKNDKVIVLDTKLDRYSRNEEQLESYKNLLAALYNKKVIGITIEEGVSDIEKYKDEIFWTIFNPSDYKYSYGILDQTELWKLESLK